MPHVDLYADDVMTTGLFQDPENAYLHNLSVYATVRPGDLKQVSERPRSGHRSLENLFSDFRLGEERRQREEEDVTTLRDVALEQRDYELLVKGLFLDDRVAPGFRYTVRYLGKDEYLFDGEAKRLDTIGLGYGRRLTFQGESLNYNDNFFWTDSSPTGFGFCIEAARPGDEFVISDINSQPVGTVMVQEVEFPQVELDTKVEGRDVIKTVQVRFTCSVKSFKHPVGLINVEAPGYAMVEGVAEVVKARGSKEARVRCINDVFIQSMGKCTLHAEP